MMLTSILIPFPPKYYKEFVAKNNTSARDRTWDLSACGYMECSYFSQQILTFKKNVVHILL